MGCFPERASAHLPGYLNGPTVGIDGEQGGFGEINIRLTALASSEGSFASRCHSRKLGKCRTLLSQGLILTRRTGQICRSTQNTSSRSLTKEWNWLEQHWSVLIWLFFFKDMYSCMGVEDGYKVFQWGDTRSLFWIEPDVYLLERSQGVKVGRCTQSFPRKAEVRG